MSMGSTQRYCEKPLLEAEEDDEDMPRVGEGGSICHLRHRREQICFYSMARRERTCSRSAETSSLVEQLLSEHQETLPTVEVLVG